MFSLAGVHSLQRNSSLQGQRSCLASGLSLQFSFRNHFRVKYLSTPTLQPLACTASQGHLLLLVPQSSSHSSSFPSPPTPLAH